MYIDVEAIKPIFRNTFIDVNQYKNINGINTNPVYEGSISGFNLDIVDIYNFEPMMDKIMKEISEPLENNNSRQMMIGKIAIGANRQPTMMFNVYNDFQKKKLLTSLKLENRYSDDNQSWLENLISYFEFNNLENDIINPLDISDEIKQIKNIWVKKVLKNALIVIINTIYRENYKIKIRIKKDIEFPEWKEIVIEIMISEIDYENLFEFWNMIEEKVRKRLEIIKIENKDEIEKINKNLAIFIDKLI